MRCLENDATSDELEEILKGISLVGTCEDGKMLNKLSKSEEARVMECSLFGVYQVIPLLVWANTIFGRSLWFIICGDWVCTISWCFLTLSYVQG